MMNTWGKILIGGGLLWFGILRGARGLVAKVHSYSFRGIDVNSGTVSLNLNVMVKNPLLVGLTLKGVVGDVYVQGVKVGGVNTTMDYYLAGGKTHILPVVVNLQMGGLGQAALMNIESGNIQNLTIAFNGKLLIGNYGVGVPLQLDLDYNDLTK